MPLHSFLGRSARRNSGLNVSEEEDGYKLNTRMTAPLLETSPEFDGALLTFNVSAIPAKPVECPWLGYLAHIPPVRPYVEDVALTSPAYHGSPPVSPLGKKQAAPLPLKEENSTVLVTLEPVVSEVVLGASGNSAPAREPTPEVGGTGGVGVSSSGGDVAMIEMNISSNTETAADGNNAASEQPDTAQLPVRFDAATAVSDTAGSDGSRCLKEGLLFKRGTGFPYSWHERRFLLSMDGLRYATPSGEPKGTFDFNSSSSALALSRADCPGRKSEFAFKVSSTANKDVFYMYAASDEERLTWIAAICAAIRRDGVNDVAPATTPAAAPVDGVTAVSSLRTATATDAGVPTAAAAAATTTPAPATVSAGGPAAAAATTTPAPATVSAGGPAAAAAVSTSSSSSTSGASAHVVPTVVANLSVEPPVVGETGLATTVKDLVSMADASTLGAVTSDNDAIANTGGSSAARAPEVDDDDADSWDDWVRNHG